MLHRICPCFFGSKTKKQHSLKSYDPRTDQQIQTQDLMMQLESQSRSTDLEGADTNETKNQQEVNEQTASNVKLQQENRIYHEKIKGPQPDPISEFVHGSQAPKLKINIATDSQYYAAVSQAVKDMQQLLSIDDSTEVSYQKVHNKLQINKSKLRVWKKATEFRHNAFIVAYELPCSYSFYNEMMSRHMQPSDNNRFIAESRLTRSLYPNLGVKYLRLNQASQLGSPEFAYLKYTNASENYHWEVCISTDLQENQGGQFSKLHSISQIVEQQTQERDQDDGQHEQGQEEDSGGEQKMQQMKILVKTYIELGADINMEKGQKLYNSLKQYVNELWEQASANYEEELV